MPIMIWIAIIIEIAIQNYIDFAILFLPFEGIYAEVVRKASLLEDLQRNYKINQNEGEINLLLLRNFQCL
jgi:hypothetical protein